MKVIRKLYLNPALRYVAVGGLTIVLDVLILWILHGIVGINVLISATFSYWLAILFNFTVNRSWTFGSNQHKTTRQVVLYLLLLGCNYVFTIVFIKFFTKHGLNFLTAKAAAVAIQVCWTYLAYRKIIFTTNTKEEVGG